MDLSSGAGAASSADTSSGETDVTQIAEASAEAVADGSGNPAAGGGENSAPLPATDAPVANEGHLLTPGPQQQLLQGLTILGGALGNDEGIAGTTPAEPEEETHLDAATVPNEAPVIDPVSAATDEDTPVSGTVTATDADGDVPSFSLGSGPSLGSVVVNADGSFTYTPGAGAQSLGAGDSGSDSFTVVATDGRGGFSLMTATVTIDGVNDAPVVVPASIAVDADQMANGTLLATDIDGDTVAFTLTSAPTQGTLTIDSTGNYSFTPDPALQSLADGTIVNDSFTVDADDGNGGVVSVTIPITITAVNDPPVVTGEVFYVSVGTTVSVSTALLLANDSDPEGDSIDIGAVAGGADVTASLGAGTVDFTMAAAGGSSFDYTVGDGNGGNSSGTVTVNGIVTDGGDNAVAIGSGAGEYAYVDGRGGNDTLIAGAGADTLLGGAGDDRFVVDSATDVVIENAGEGDDTIVADFDSSLAGLPEVENLELGGSGDFTGTGNGGANRITGNSGANTLDGGGGNDTLDGGAGSDEMQGGAGDDTYIVGVGDVLVENAGEGTDLVLAAATHTLEAEIENLTLTGSAAIDGTGNTLDNVITGNGGNNHLRGDDGADTLEGGAGIDTLEGGAGDDSYVVNSGTDQIVEAPGGGTDTVTSSVTFSIAPFADVENLTLTGTDNIDGTGNGGDNVITGNGGNNSLSGGGGIDTLIGGAGDDTYAVDDSGDFVDEAAGQGTDHIRSAVDFDLATTPAVENLTLTGSSDLTGDGNDLNNRITGNSGANDLTGGLGADTITGGSGADTMTGGAGNDVYVIGSDLTDTIVEAAGEGFDTVNTAVTFDLGTLANIENLTLSGSADVDGTGTDVRNRLTGNTGNNLLLGLGGDDQIDGGAGNDTIDGGSGVDTIDLSAATAGVAVTLVQSGGDTIIDLSAFGLGIDTYRNMEGLIGTDFADSFTGSSGDDTLDGGAGADSMAGGTGDDVYVVEDAGDDVSEQPGEGTDLIRSAVSFDLTDAANVENLTLTGSANINATGDGNANELTGNGGNNVLTGGGGDDTLNGGAGVDTLIGGAGDDVYLINTLTDEITENAGDGFDTITTASVSVNLGSYANIENLTLNGSLDLDGTGSAARNRLTGNAGNNALDGAGGEDIITANDGDDTIAGGSGDDTVTGGAGADRIDAAGDRDSIVYLDVLDAGDTIATFGTGGAEQDVIDLDALFDALNGGIAAGDRAGRVIMVTVGGDVELQIDTAAGTGAGDGVGDVTLLTFQGLGGTGGLSVGTGAADDIQVGS